MSEIPDERIRDILLRCYNETVSEIEPLGGYMSATFLVRTNIGRRVLKIYGRGGRDKNKIAYTHEVLTFLNDQQFPAVKLLRSQSGETLVEWNSETCALFDFARGTAHKPGNLKQLTNAGGALRDYHRIVAGFQTSKAVQWPTMKTFVINRLKEELEEVGSAVRTDAAGPVGARCIDELKEQLDGTEKSLSTPDYNELPATVIHGDWRAQNMKFDGDRVSCVLDFDFARPAKRLFDIGYALLFFPAIISPTPPSDEEIAVFLRAYREGNPLAEIELRLLPCFLQLSFLRGITLWLKIYYLDKIRGNLAEWIRKYIPLSEMLDEISERIV